jgi:hypothetical protein
MLSCSKQNCWSEGAAQRWTEPGWALGVYSTYLVAWLLKSLGGETMKYASESTLLSACMALLLAASCIQPGWAESSRITPESFAKDMLSRGLGFPPYSMEVSVESVHGLPGEGIKDLLETCLRENLRSLGVVEFVDHPGTEKPPAQLRLRVWFTQKERPDEYECFDTTLVVMVSKILTEDPRYDAVLDTYALAGVAERDVNSMCNKIATRLDLKILSVLRKLRESAQ